MRITVASACALAVLSAVAIGLLLRSDDSDALEELRAYPGIAIVWAHCCQTTQAGNLYVSEPGAEAPRLVKSWGDGAVNGDGPYGAYSAKWSPDRSSIGIALAAWFGDPYTSVHVISSTGKNLRRLTGWGCWEFEDWSPDGKQLYVADHLCSHETIEAVPATGGRPSRLPIPPRRVRDIVTLDWSRDGKRIAASLFAKDFVSTSRGILAMNADGSTPRRLTYGDDSDPVWSPDGRTILFTRSNKNVFVIGADGQGLRRLTSDSRSEALDWSPDGQRILFSKNQDEDPRGDDLWVMDADGGRATRLLGEPGWSFFSADWGR